MTSYLEELLPNENSLGWKLLNWIEENKEGSATDIHQILTQRKAILLLPTEINKKIEISRNFIEDHILVTTQFEPEKILKSFNFKSIVVKDDRIISINSELQDNVVLNLLFNKLELIEEFGTQIIQNFMEIEYKSSIIQIVIISKSLSSVETINLFQPNEPLSSEKILEFKLRNLEDSNIKHKIMLTVLKVVDQIQATHRPVQDKLAQKVQELYIQIIDDYPQLNIIENIEDFVTNQIYPKLFAYGQDAKQDELIDSKIIVLNKFEIQLGVLDPYLEENSERYNLLILASKRAGDVLKKINNSTSPKDKLNTIILAHEELSGSLISENEVQYLNFETNNYKPIEIELTDLNKVDPCKVKLPPSPIDDDENSENDAKEIESKSISNAELNCTVESDQPPPLPKRNSHIEDSRRMISADELLPLLIYSIIISNPSNIYSNLKYIQRFRHVDGITDRESYCLTNMLAALSYIETFDIQSINPPSSKIQSPQLNEQANSTAASSSLSISNVANISKDVTGEGVRAFSGMMDMVMGRFWSPTPKPNSHEPTPSVTPPLAPVDSTTAVTRTSLDQDTAEAKLKKLNLATKSRPQFSQVYKTEKFENLKVSELKDLFDNYSELINYLTELENIINN